MTSLLSTICSTCRRNMKSSYLLSDSWKFSPSSLSSIDTKSNCQLCWSNSYPHLFQPTTFWIEITQLKTLLEKILFLSVMGARSQLLGLSHASSLHQLSTSTSTMPSSWKLFLWQSTWPTCSSHPTPAIRKTST